MSVPLTCLTKKTQCEDIRTDTPDMTKSGRRGEQPGLSGWLP